MINPSGILQDRSGTSRVTTPSDPPPDDPPPRGTAGTGHSVALCKKCGGKSERILTLQATFDRSTFEILRCMACKNIEWTQRD